LSSYPEKLKKRQLSNAMKNGFRKWRLRNLIFAKLNKLLKHWELQVTVHLPLKGRQILI
jgi:hypothetical protein